APATSERGTCAPSVNRRSSTAAGSSRPSSTRSAGTGSSRRSASAATGPSSCSMVALRLEAAVRSVRRAAISSGRTRGAAVGVWVDMATIVHQPPAPIPERGWRTCAGPVVGAGRRQRMRAGRASERLADLTAPLTRRDCLTHVETRPPRDGRQGSFPEWADPRLVTHLAQRGITAPWIHQEQAARLAHTGRDVVLATATASGKSLAYLLPVLTAIGARELDPEERRATALYLSPTKALAADQLTNIAAMADGAGIRDARVAVYDGDTPSEQRRWVRRHGTVVLTNPDMLH